MFALSAIVTGLPIGCRDRGRSLATIAALARCGEVDLRRVMVSAFFVSVLIMASVGSTGERDDATEHRVQQLGAAELVERLAAGGEVEARRKPSAPDAARGLAVAANAFRLQWSWLGRFGSASL